jgi:hypothetical protein
LVAIYALILNRHGMLSSQWAAIFAPDTLMQVRNYLLLLTARRNLKF